MERVPFVVCEDLNVEVIVGTDVMGKFECAIDFFTKQAFTRTTELSAVRFLDPDKPLRREDTLVTEKSALVRMVTDVDSDNESENSRHTVVMRPELEDGEITDDDLPELFDTDSDMDELESKPEPTSCNDGDSEGDGNESDWESCDETDWEGSDDSDEEDWKGPLPSLVQAVRSSEAFERWVQGKGYRGADSDDEMELMAQYPSSSEDESGTDDSKEAGDPHSPSPKESSDEEVNRMHDEGPKEPLESEDVITEVRGGVFYSRDALAHCVSEDCHMAVGVARQATTHFATLRNECRNQGTCVGGVAIFADRCVIPGRYVYNLVTKRLYSDKPTYEALESALIAMKEHAVNHGVDKISMPRIGCGLDRLRWEIVAGSINRVFAGSGIRITVYVPVGTEAPQTESGLTEEREK